MKSLTKVLTLAGAVSLGAALLSPEAALLADGIGSNPPRVLMADGIGSNPPRVLMADGIGSNPPRVLMA